MMYIIDVRFNKEDGMDEGSYKTIAQILEDKKGLAISPDWTGCKPTEQDVAEYERGPAQA
jgi:hypothetical protein